MAKTIVITGVTRGIGIGLALTAVPVAELDAVVTDLIGALTAPLPGAVRETKALLVGAAGRELDEQSGL